MKWTYYMLSDFPPWQVYRWRLDHDKEIDVIERYDIKTESWITHDNALLRGAFMDQQDASLTTIDPVTDDEVKKIVSEGWDAIK